MGVTARSMLASVRSLDLVLRDITAEDITPFFQPITDLFTGAVVGYEVLSRGPLPFESPALLFDRSRELGLTPELERACQAAAFARIATLSREQRWFVNVTPEVFAGSEASDLAAEVRAHGIEPSAIVLELTERDVITDHDRFQRAVRAHAGEGFSIALDDFGSGSSGLVTLLACMPQVIKLDMQLTRGVNADPYKQTLVRSIVSMAASVDARLIAEGVETWQELEMLARQGVRFAQGRVLAGATFEPADLSESVRAMLMRTIARCSPASSNLDDAVARLAVRTFSLDEGSMTAAELESVFHGDPDLDCAVILRELKPIGAITRTHLLSQMSGPYGYSLAARTRVESIAKPLTLAVDERASVVRLATLAMDRDRGDLYDPVVVVTPDGAYHGTVTMRQLIMRAAELLA